MDTKKKLEAFIVYLCETCRQLDEFQHRLMHMQVCHLIIIIMTIITEHIFHLHNHQLNTIIIIMTFIIAHNSHHHNHQLIAIIIVFDVMTIIYHH